MQAQRQTRRERPRQERTAAPPPAPIFTEEEARHIEHDALDRALETSEEAIELRRRGRIEAETRRISEEVTRQARERRRRAPASGA